MHILVIFFIGSPTTNGRLVFDCGTLHGPPGSIGDDYIENIAFQLAKTVGVTVDFSEPDWKLPYIDANDNPQSDWIVSLKHKEATTSRSPGFPWVVSLVYRITGRQFIAVGVVNVPLIAGAITLLLHLVFRIYGCVAGAIALITISLDYFVLRNAGQFLSEALGTSITCVLLVACISLSGTSSLPSRWQTPAWLGIGVLFGLGSLVRANISAWFLIIVVAVGALIVRRYCAGQAWQPLLKNEIGFCIGVTLISSPWWIRNCQVTGAFAPFGTSGSLSLAGGYCDEAYENFGN